MRKITPFLIIFFSFLHHAITAQTYVAGSPGMFTFDQLMGVNTLRDDPVEPMNCVGFVREYHDWIIDEGDAINPNNIGQFGSDPFPDQLFKWNPPYQGKTETQFDYFYQEMQDKGLTICADMTRTLHVYEASGSNDALLERQPLEWNFIGGQIVPADGPGANNLPESYKERTDWIHNFVARYGHSQNVT